MFQSSEKKTDSKTSDEEICYRKARKNPTEDK